MSLGKSINSFSQGGEEFSPEDVLRLQSLEKDFGSEDYYWYLEPVEVNTYIKEEARFDVTIELLKIKLPLVEPLDAQSCEFGDLSRRWFDWAWQEDRLIDLRAVMEQESEAGAALDGIYKQHYPLLERWREQVSLYEEGNPHALRAATYITETLLKFEPSYISLKIIGDVHTHNLNWLIAKQNENRVLLNLEVDTVEYLINRCDLYGKEAAFDPDYQRLSALFLHKMRFLY